jgi:cell wall-associated NlpC family hydrolase
VATVAGATAICLLSAPAIASASPTGPAAPGAHAAPTSAAGPVAPSDGEVVAAQAARDAAVAQLADLAARLAEAQAQVDAAHAAADIALDTYQAKQAEYEAAQVTADATAAAAQQADADLAAAQAAVTAFARESYIQGTTRPALQAMLDVQDPAAMLERGRLLAAAGGHRADVLLAFADAQRHAATAAANARTAVDAAATLQQQAADALTAAEAVESAARQQAAAFAAEQVDLQARLDQAQADLADLEGARAAAAEYARQQAAAQAAIDAQRGAAEDVALPPVAAGSPEAVRTAIDAAVAKVGIRYAWGGGSPSGPSLGFGIDAGIVGFDCSGLTRYAYAQAGIGLARNSRAQYETLPKVDRSSLRPGDLVFWAMDVHDPATIHHVALYLGGGKIVEAPHSGASVHVTSMYWSGYIGAVRPSA